MPNDFPGRSLNILFSEMGDMAQHMAHGTGRTCVGGLSSACVRILFAPRVNRDLPDDRVTPAYLENRLLIDPVPGPRPLPLLHRHAYAQRMKQKRCILQMHSNCSADVAPPALWSGVLLRSQVHLMACLSAFLDHRRSQWIGYVPVPFSSKIDCGVALIISNYVSKDTKG